jgi:hypothetical protein
MNNTNGAGSGDWDIFYRCNLTGSSWEGVQVISEPVFGKDFNIGGSMFPCIAVEDDKIYVVWYDSNNTNGAGTGDWDIFYRCNLTGSSWEDVQVISEPVFGQDFNIGGSMFPCIAVENGKVYVVWQDGNNTNGAGAGEWDIFYRANLTSTSWEDIQVISEPEIGRNLNIWDSSLPDIAVENGKIFTVWQDKNDTNGAGTDDDIFFRCNLTAFSWEDVEVISEPIPGQNSNSGMRFYASIAAWKSKVGIVWSDTNYTNGAGPDADVIYRWKLIKIPSLFFAFPKVTPTSGNTSTEFNFTIKYYQLNDTQPQSIKVIIDGMEYSMLQVDSMDIDYRNGKKYYFTIKNLNIGTHTYEFNATDGINYTNTKLFNNLKVINTIPQIITENNLTAIEDQYYRTNYEFEDMDIANVGQVCHWEFATNTGWLSFNSLTGELFGTPGNTDVGQYWVYIGVNDTIEVGYTNFTLTVLDVNDLPMIITEDVLVTNEDELYEVDYDAADIDSVIKNQIWSLETNATSWLNISSSTGILNGTPGNDDVGEYWINVSVNDTEGGYDFTNFTLTVLNVNDDPVIITKDKLIVETDKLYEVQYKATDIDSPLSKQVWSITTNASWLSIDPNTGILSGTPTRNNAGFYFVNVTVSDGDGGSDWQIFVVNVYLGNLPPIITTEDVVTAKVNKTYLVDYNATDDWSIELLEWSVHTNASWLSIENITGILSGTPAHSQGGKRFWVNVSVIDTQYGFDFHNFTIKVLKEPKVVIINNIPQLLNFKMTPNIGDTDTDFTFSVTYFDLDDEVPTIIHVVIDGNNYDMLLKSGEIAYNGRYEFKTKLSEGIHSYYFIASDGKDTNTSAIFTTPKIESPEKIKDDEAEKEGLAWELLIFGIVIIIIVVLIVVFLIISRKKKKEQEQETIPPAEPEIAEPPEEPPIYPEYEKGEQQDQEDLYYTPPEETTTDTTYPDSWTQEQPEEETEFEE